MSPRHPATFLSLWLLPLVLLLVLGTAMLADAAGATAASGHLLSNIFGRLHPMAEVTDPAGNLAGGETLRPGAWLDNATALWPALLFLMLAGVLMLMLLARGWTFLAGIFAAFAIAFAMGIAWVMFARARVLVDMLSPALVLVLAYASAPFLRGIQASTRRPQPARVAPAIVSPAPELVTGETAEPEPPPPIRAENRTVTCLVCRVRGYAHPDRQLEPVATLTLLNKVMAPLVEAIAHHRGQVLYASGTQLAGVWNGLTNDGEHAIHACEAALRMQHALTQMKIQHGEGTPYDFVELAMGLATGPAVAGSAGTREGVAVAGECVGIADRLSGRAHYYGLAILTDQATRNCAEGGFALLEADAIAVDGKAMAVYALLGNPLVRASPKFRALSTFHTHLFTAIRGQRWEDARTLIDQCSHLSGAIPQLYDLHMKRVAWYESNPPPQDWDGAFRPPII